MALITINEYYTYDGMVSPYDTAETAKITQAITVASALIEKMCGGRDLDANASPVEEIAIVNGKGTARLYMPNAPVLGVTKIEYWDGDEWEEVNATNDAYTFKPNSRIVYFTEGYKAWSGYQNWRVTYTYGWTSVPEDLQYACYVVAKLIRDESERQNVNTQTTGEQSFAYSHKIPAQALEIINRYKHHG